MPPLGNKRKMAAVSGETQEHRRNAQSQNTFVPGITEEYMTRFLRRLKCGSIKKLPEEFSRTEFCIFGALYKLDNFLLSPRTSRNNDVENREPTGGVPRVIRIWQWSSLPAGQASRLIPIRTKHPTW